MPKGVRHGEEGHVVYGLSLEKSLSEIHRLNLSFLRHKLFLIPGHAEVDASIHKHRQVKPIRLGSPYPTSKENVIGFLRENTKTELELFSGLGFLYD